MSPSMVSLLAITLNFSPFEIRVSAPKYEFRECLRSFRNFPGVFCGWPEEPGGPPTTTGLADPPPPPPPPLEGNTGGVWGDLVPPDPDNSSPGVADELDVEAAPEETPEELGEVSTEGALLRAVAVEENGPIRRDSNGLIRCSGHSPYLT